MKSKRKTRDPIQKKRLTRQSLSGGNYVKSEKLQFGKERGFNTSEIKEKELRWKGK